jgi:tRNA A37 methylthiotransferase MiaB
MAIVTTLIVGYQEKLRDFETLKDFVQEMRIRQNGTSPTHMRKTHMLICTGDDVPDV